MAEITTTACKKRRLQGQNVHVPTVEVAQLAGMIRNVSLGKIDTAMIGPLARVLAMACDTDPQGGDFDPANVAVDIQRVLQDDARKNDMEIFGLMPDKHGVYVYNGMKFREQEFISWFTGQLINCDTCKKQFSLLDSHYRRPGDDSDICKDCYHKLIPDEQAEWPPCHTDEKAKECLKLHYGLMFKDFMRNMWHERPGLFAERDRGSMFVDADKPIARRQQKCLLEMYLKKYHLEGHEEGLLGAWFKEGIVKGRMEGCEYEELHVQLGSGGFR